MKTNPAQIQQQSPDQYDHIRRKMEAKGPEAFGEMMEGIFLHQMLEQMNKAMLGEGMFGSSNQGKIFQGMFTQKIADQISETGGIGLAEIISRYMQFKGVSPTTQLSGISTEDSNNISDKFFPLEQSAAEVLKQRSIRMEEDGDQ